MERVWRQIQDLFWITIFFLEKKWEKGNEEIEGTEGKQMRFERWDRVLWPDYAGAESSIEERGKEIVAEGK